jgi:hypothetical protein
VPHSNTLINKVPVLVSHSDNQIWFVMWLVFSPVPDSVRHFLPTYYSSRQFDTSWSLRVQIRRRTCFIGVSPTHFLAEWGPEPHILKLKPNEFSLAKPQSSTSCVLCHSCSHGCPCSSRGGVPDDKSPDSGWVGQLSERTPVTSLKMTEMYVDFLCLSSRGRFETSGYRVSEHITVIVNYGQILEREILYLENC